MGMAASQARYLSLAARMNDIEFQGQQINQQRTTLSNQATNYYNSLLDLKVPTPPSTKDFTKIVYSGNMGGAKFTIGTVTPGTTNGLYNVDLNYTRTGHYWSSTGTTSVTRGKQFYVAQDDPDLTSLKMTSNFNKYKVDGNKNDVNKEELAKLFNQEESQNSVYSLATDVYVELTGEDIKKLGDNYKKNIYQATSNEQGEYLTKIDSEKIEKSQTYRIKFDMAALQDAKIDEISLYDKITAGDDSAINAYAYTNNEGKYTNNTAVKAYYDFEDYDLDGKTFNNSNFKILANGTIREASKDDFDIDSETGEITLKSGRQILKQCTEAEYNSADESKQYTEGNDVDQISIGNSAYTLQPASAYIDITTEEGKSYLEGLKHAFPKVWTESNSNNETFLNKFEGYKLQTNSGTETIKLIPKNALTGECKNVPVYEYAANGTYEDAETKVGCQLEFDSDGRIKRIGVPTTDGWDWVDLKTAETTDNDSYEDAFNQYEYQKYIYDKKQNEINAKISIIQQEDKNLELKLTRLDNERNAVNTELEAVKKVVSDNIEKSYKTFSG